METVFHTSLVVLSILYTVLFMSYARIFARGEDGVARYSALTLAIAVGLHFFSLLARGVAVGACPLESRAESLSLVAFSIAVIYAMVELRIKERTTGVFVIAPAFLLQTIATVSILDQDAPAGGRMGVYGSLESFAVIVAFSAVAVCAVYGLLYLFLYGAIKAGRFGLFFRKMPSLETLSDLNFAAASIAFLALTATFAMRLWDRFGAPDDGAILRRPDVILTASLWMLYGGSVAARRFFGLGGKRLAYTTVVGSILLVAVFLGGLGQNGPGN